jgi:mono/diheme cytochrome c family protein
MAVVGVSSWIAAGIGVNTAAQPGAPVWRSGIRTGTFAVTPVSGPSSLHRLRLTVRRSAMGSVGLSGSLPLQDVASVETAGLTPSLVVTGSDLYRFNCRPCHRADGTGVPPEINSLIDLVRSTSPAVMWQRMQEKGRPISAAFARELASDSRKDLLTRLASGGKKMPAFDHLEDAEIDALVAYLEWMAGLAGAERRQIRVAESLSRIGEHVVKGTCHICHDATGSWPDAEALIDGAVPPLAELPRHHSTFGVIQKVREGGLVSMGRPAYQYRGRMPVFSYLRNDEVAAAYMYLLAYPPCPTAALVAQ